MPRAGKSSTNHPGIIDFKGKSSLFYHNDFLPGGGGYHRSVCVELFQYNSHGTIPTINMTASGAPQIAYLNPYNMTQAETICEESGVETETCSEGGMNVSYIQLVQKGRLGWTGQVLFRNRKFYWYVCTEYTNGKTIDVAVYSKPTGPFRDAPGHPLITNDMTRHVKHSWDNLDPAGFIDDNGQASLSWGSNACFYVKLKKNDFFKGPCYGNSFIQ